MELTAKTTPDVLLVTANASRIDASVAIQFKDQMRDLTENGPDVVVLDLEQVQFIDSSGLGAIVAAMKLVGSNRRLELANLSPTVQKVFQLTRMDSIFTIHPSVDASLKAKAS